MDVDTTLTRKLARRHQEELLALDEIEQIVGELPPGLVEQRERTQRQLDELDRALIAAAQNAEPVDA